jgi:hypothetical protein
MSHSENARMIQDQSGVFSISFYFYFLRSALSVKNNPAAITSNIARGRGSNQKHKSPHQARAF